MASQSVVTTATLRGVEAIQVTAEVEVGPGLPSFSIVGLPDAAVQEARERVRSSLRASGFEVPNARIVVNLAPGPLRKHGTGFDLPIALGVLAATRQLPPRLVRHVLAVGELSLDGSVRIVPGMLAYAVASRDCGMPLLASVDSVGSTRVEGVTHLPLRSLAQLKDGLPGPSQAAQYARLSPHYLDFIDVHGHELAKRALLIAAAGGHNLLMVGPPGSGKSMLARCLPSILPPLSERERVETALVHSVAGLDDRPALDGVRPFRAPHHAASIAGLIGGGSPPRPGEVSLAHNGVLFLDEMPEFGPASLQCLRQPMEDHRVTLIRADGRVTYPARFALVAASNPCPCGYLGDSQKTCSCTASVIHRYQNRIGGPLMDRIDLKVQVSRVDPHRLLTAPSGPCSADMRADVAAARERAQGRCAGRGGAMSGSGLLAACRLTDAAVRSLERSARANHLSGRAVTRLLRVARTIADIERHERVDRSHLCEALGYRLEEPTWG